MPEPHSRFLLQKPLLVSPRVSFLYQRSVCLPLELLGLVSRQQVLLEQTQSEQKPPQEPLPYLRESPLSEWVKPPRPEPMVSQVPSRERLPELPWLAPWAFPVRTHFRPPEEPDSKSAVKSNLFAWAYFLSVRW